MYDLDYILSWRGENKGTRHKIAQSYALGTDFLNISHGKKRTNAYMCSKSRGIHAEEFWSRDDPAHEAEVAVNGLMCYVLFLLILLWPTTSVGAYSISGHPRVVDGDTLAFGKNRVRMQGIDAPESRQKCRRWNGTLYSCGKMATAALIMRIGIGDVSCEIEGKGRYGRYISVCHAEDGADLNAWMVSSGWAMAYRKYSMRYVEEEGSAKESQAGIWQGKFTPPWEWRIKKR